MVLTGNHTRISRYWLERYSCHPVYLWRYKMKTQFKFVMGFLADEAFVQCSSSLSVVRSEKHMEIRFAIVALALYLPGSLPNPALVQDQGAPMLLQALTSQPKL